MVDLKTTLNKNSVSVLCRLPAHITSSWESAVGPTQNGRYGPMLMYSI